MATTKPAEAGSLDLSVQGMTCGSCAARVQRVLARQAAVTDAEVNFATGRAQVRTDGPADVAVLQAAVERIGYRIEPLTEGRPTREHDDAAAALQRSWLWRVVAVAPAAAFAVVTMLLGSRSNAAPRAALGDAGGGHPGAVLGRLAVPA